MIAYIYRMRLKRGREADYDAAWREATLIARERFGSGGSHLFTAQESIRVAIALWPDAASRDRFFAWGRANPAGPGRVLSDAVEEYLGEEMLTSIDDLWVSGRQD